MKCFWWEKITGPSMFIEKIADLLREKKAVVLILPSDLHWRQEMRASARSKLNNLQAEQVYFENPDISIDNTANLSPGQFILNQYGSRDIINLYRETPHNPIHAYLVQNNVLENRVLWIKGIPEDRMRDWLDFFNKYTLLQNHQGFLVLEVRENFQLDIPAALTTVKFRDYITNYDIQIFNSFVISKKNLSDDTNLSDEWKNYISVLTATVCDLDAELSEKVIQTADFSDDSIDMVLETLMLDDPFSIRGHEQNSTHVLSYLRSHRKDEINNRVWKAQIQILFPIIEMERIQIIKKWEENIQAGIEKYPQNQYGVEVRNAVDLEIGTLRYMIRHRNANQEEYLIWIPDESTRDRIDFLYELRNKLAHKQICSPLEVGDLLG